MGIMGATIKLSGQIDIHNPQTLHSITLYPDVFQENVYYYMPNGLRMAMKDENIPDFQFLQTRYVGTKVHGDQGEFSFRNFLRFRIVMEMPDRDSLALVKEKLTGAQLHPLPIKHIETSLQYKLSDREMDWQNTTNGSMVEQVNEQFWMEKEYMLRLDNDNAEILAKSLKEGIGRMSVFFTYWALGVLDLSDPEINADSLLEKAWKEDGEKNISNIPIYTDVLSISIGEEQLPAIHQVIDLDTVVQGAYAKIDIFDYSHQLEKFESLHAKRLEIQAKSVDGTILAIRHSFRYKGLAETYKILGFPYAVRTDESYQYRITTILKDGRLLRGDWNIARSWADPIDITRGPETIIEN